VLRRRLAVLVAIGLLAPISALVGDAQAPASAKAAIRDGLPMQEMAKVVGDTFNLAPPPAGQTPAQRAQWLLYERAALGRTPAGWLGWAQSSFDLKASAVRAPRVADLTAEVLRTYALVGITPLAPDRARIAAQAESLPPVVRVELAALVATVNDVYAAQAPLAAAVVSRFDAGLDPHKPLLSVTERDAATGRQQAIVAALARFRAVALPALAGTAFATAFASDVPIFSDPEGLIVLGGTGDSTYDRGGLVPDPVLLVDPAGNDIYNNSAGGACPVTPSAPVTNGGLAGTWLRCNGLVVSAVADLGTTSSNDQYLYNGEPAAVQGAGGPGGIGVLVDAGGNDRYDVTMTRGNVNPFVPAVYYFDGGAQGYGYGGAGLMLDAAGDDSYRFATSSSAGRSIWALGQGFGGAGGVGAAVDLGGSDKWDTPGLGITGNGDFPFQGIYTMGVGIYAGVGILSDTGLASDTYSSTVTATTTDYYAQGFGAFGGLGIQFDDGGDDSYVATETATDPWIQPLLNCAFGTGSYAGVGIFWDGGGNDTYFGATTSPYAASIDDFGAGHPGVSYGLFLDSGGTDRYEMKAVSTGGWGAWTSGLGYWEPGIGDPVNDPVGENTFGTFADLGGAIDTYIGTPAAATNNSQWAFGVDR
jgi:hypothetical protein